jgi:hypothetical protein
MQIENALRKMLRHASEESSAPDVEQFRQRMREYSKRPAPEDNYSPSGRTWAFGLAAFSTVVVAISAVWFVAVEYPAAIAAQQELARAQTETTTRLVQSQVSQAQAQVAATRIRPYSDRIVEGLQKLQLSHDPSDREMAIWQDLLPVLKEAQRNRDDFINVAIEYRKVLPLLRVGESSPFRESYWGELWIYNILLNSKINPVVEDARRTAPPVTVVEQVLREHGTRLSADKRMAFEEAVLAYSNAIKTIQ